MWTEMARKADQEYLKARATEVATDTPADADDENSKKDRLGMRMKGYEKDYESILPIGLPKIIRVDMRAGHTFCKQFDRPFDDVFSYAMVCAAEDLAKEIPGARLAYTQSDEISVLLTDFSNPEQPHCLFNGRIQKIASVAASIATLGFNRGFAEIVAAMKARGEHVDCYEEKLWKAQFDARIFCLPSIEEVMNYFRWRVVDARRNSVSMIARKYFDQSALMHKNMDEVVYMLEHNGPCVDIEEDYPNSKRLGIMIAKSIEERPWTNPKTGETGIADRNTWKTYEFDYDELEYDVFYDIYHGARFRDGELE